MKEQTNVLLDKDLKDEAQKAGIKFGKALEEYLETLLHKGGLKKKYEERKQYHLDKAKEYRAKIKELDRRLEIEKDIKGDMDERMEKAINIAVMVHDNEGGLTDDRIRDIAQQQIVDPGELIEKVKQKFTTKKG